MAAKKSAAKQAPADNKVFKVEPSKDTPSQTLAKLATTSVLSAITLQSYSGAGDALEVTEMKKAGDDADAMSEYARARFCVFIRVMRHGVLRKFRKFRNDFPPGSLARI